MTDGLIESNPLSLSVSPAALRGQSEMIEIILKSFVPPLGPGQSSIVVVMLCYISQNTMCQYFMI